ncbi:MAG: aspartate kinase, partial [Candidatus Thermoplasmatota archaeon]|nr:aspartate kinase [Candidatus Thermoplasmatota archaeon]
MKIVMKFGGVSVADGENMRNVGKIVERFRAEENELVVVTSAMFNVTNSLLDAATRAGKGQREHVLKFVEDTMERHIQSARTAISGKDVLERTIHTIESKCEDLKNILLGIAHIGELTPRSKDFVVGFGERFSAPILQGVLEDLGMKAIAMTGGVAGISTDDQFGWADPLMNVTTLEVRQVIDPLVEKGVVPVVGGFTAATQDGTQTTLGRGGSDFTASIIGAAIRADEVWVWKDVEGLMTANPMVVKDARMIERISFSEAMELAHFGAQVIHPKALESAGRFQLPFR